MKRKLSLAVNMLRMLISYASGQGIDTQEICADAGFDPSLPDDAGARISSEIFNAVWKEVITRSPDNDFGLHMAESMQYASGSHLLIVVMMNSPTVGSALESFCRYHNLMNDTIRPKITPDDDIALLGWDASIPGYASDRHETELLLCILNSAFRRLTEGTCRPLEVRLRHPRPNDISEHTRIFQAPLRFNQPMNALVIDKKHLEKPVTLADSDLLKTLEDYALRLLHRIYAPDTWADKVAKTISKRMYEQRPNIESVAGDLAVSARNLQNKLKAEGTTFQELLDHVRKETALTLLKDPNVSIYDVSFLLGFSEQSSFNHAFRRWTGSTPKAYRQNMKKD
jgi:AraC-like DNA-binding protein